MRKTPPPRRKPIDWKRRCACRKFEHAQIDGKDICNKCRRPIPADRMKKYRSQQQAKFRALNQLAGVDD